MFGEFAYIYLQKIVIYNKGDCQRSSGRSNYRKKRLICSFICGKGQTYRIICIFVTIEERSIFVRSGLAGCFCCYRLLDSCTPPDLQTCLIVACRPVDHRQQPGRKRNRKSKERTKLRNTHNREKKDLKSSSDSHSSGAGCVKVDVAVRGCPS